jgi:dTDP-4-dehydrorhamnose 3,5-epimerase
MRDAVLDGIEVIDLRKNADERGSFTEIMREDWNDFLHGERPVQSNLSISYPGMIRAWHRHTRGQYDIFVVLKGALKICAYNDVEEKNMGELVEIVASGERLQAVKINGKYWHGTKCVSPVPAETVYYVTRLYDRERPDELRRAWNDPAIVPKSINGNVHDPRAGRTWDWNSPPHK